MADIVYNSVKKKLLEKSIDFVNDTIRVALLSSAYSPSQDNDEYLDDVIAYEIAGTGYSSWGTAITGKTVTQDNTNNLGKFDGDDVVWPSATFTARYAVVFKSTGVTGTSPLIRLLDFGTVKSPSGVDFQITWHSDGILRTT
jgi:hypothetical protein